MNQSLFCRNARNFHRPQQIRLDTEDYKEWSVLSETKTTQIISLNNWTKYYVKIIVDYFSILIAITKIRGSKRASKVNEVYIHHDNILFFKVVHHLNGVIVDSTLFIVCVYEMIIICN